jgi:hypothetical protein
MKKSSPQNRTFMDEIGARLKERMGKTNARNLEEAFVDGKEAWRVQDVAKHGEFGPWIKQWDLSKSEIYNFIDLAKNEDRVRSAGCQSIRQALELLKPSKPKKAKAEIKTEVEPGAKNEPEIDLADINAWFEKDPVERVNTFFASMANTVRVAFAARVPVLQKQVRTELKKRSKPFDKMAKELADEARSKAPSQAQIDETAAIAHEAEVINLALRRGLLQPALH